jgi:hypothetical protein
MHLHARYKKDLSDKVGKTAAHPRPEISETNDSTRTVKELVTAASGGGQTIAHVLIRGEHLR